MKKLTLSLLLVSTSFLTLHGQTIELWPEGVPNAIPNQLQEKVTDGGIKWIEGTLVPTLEIYLPSERLATGQAVVIFPGGGYVGTAYDWEGTEFAKWMNAQGIAAFVVKYRMPLEGAFSEPWNVPLQDAQRAMRVVRANAKDWNLDPKKIGVMGFSAGGHLASTLATQYDQPVYQEQNGVSAKPDFMILAYPVISMDQSITHMGSRNHLLGEDPNQKLVDRFSNEKHVTKNTPTTFLVHTADDGAVPMENSINFYEALTEKGVTAELHLYPSGEHGFGLAVKYPHLRTWTDRLLDWLKQLEQ